MKKLLFVVLALLVVAVLCDAQTISVQREVSTGGLHAYRTGTTFVARSYADDQIDTTTAYDMASWENAYVVISSTDSIDVSLGYMPSYDGTSFKAPVTISSFTSVVAAGNVLAIALPAGALGCPKVQLTFTFNSSGNGVAGTTTYSAKLVRKR
jgi:hypothetical protein